MRGMIPLHAQATGCCKELEYWWSRKRSTQAALCLFGQTVRVPFFQLMFDVMSVEVLELGDRSKDIQRSCHCCNLLRLLQCSFNLSSHVDQDCS